MGPKKVQSKYYGGDEFQEDDEESVKLFLKDCHTRQTALYSTTPLTHSTSGVVLAAFTKGELLYTSGQSRLHLHLHEWRGGAAEHISTGEMIDFGIFSRQTSNLFKLSQFPSNLEDEASAFRSHGLPLLVWPRAQDAATIQKFLDDNYQDCAKWFRELVKAMKWLNEKWKPLSFLLGLEKKSIDKPVLKGLPDDCVAITFIKERTTWIESYVHLLQSYLVHRRVATPGFQHNTIHHQLNVMEKERLQALPNDSGFFNVAGDRLLQLGNVAENQGKRVTLKIHEMAKKILDAQKRAQFLSVLLPMAELKDALSTKKVGATKSAVKSKSSSFVQAKAALVEALAESEDEGEEIEEGCHDEDMEDDINSSGSDDDNNEKKAKDTPKELPSVLFPNRPITKEIMENRGTVKYRHKRERNPRVHLRHKFKKSQIRRKSRVPTVRKEEAPYAGEMRGIRVNLIKSHRFKKPS